MTARVLIAEDEESIIASLEFVMRRNGYQTCVARDGMAAVARVGDFHPDLVLLDVMLPGKSGLDVCRAIRATSATARLPVIMLTAKGGRTDIARGLEAGADDYVIKPFSTRDLVGRVEKLLGTCRR